MNISVTTKAAKQLVGDECGEAYRVGQRLTLRLAEANPVSGSLRFELPEGSYGTPPPRAATIASAAAGRPTSATSRGSLAPEWAFSVAGNH